MLTEAEKREIAEQVDREFGPKLEEYRAQLQKTFDWIDEQYGGNGTRITLKEYTEEDKERDFLIASKIFDEVTKDGH